MKAYHGDPQIKTGILKQLEAHRAADQLVKGVYWSAGKGCAVGCTIHSGNHMEYEHRFGIPVILARLEDCIFEGLPNDQAMGWPIRFMSAIPVGSDLSLVGWRFLHWLLTDEISISVSDDTEIENINVQCRSAIADCAEILRLKAKDLSVTARATAHAVHVAARATARATAHAADAAYAAAYAAAYTRMAAKLIQLIENVEK